MAYLTQLGVAGIIIYLFLREMFPFLLKVMGITNGKAKCGSLSPLNERRVADLEAQVKELEHQRHGVIMPILRWHDNEIAGAGGERSKTLMQG